MFLLCDGFGDVQGGGGDHRDQFADASGGEEPDGVLGVGLAHEGEPCGHVVLLVEEDPLVVLVHDDPDLLALPVLCIDVDVLFFPVVVEFDLDFLSHCGLDGKIIEASAEESVGLDVGVGHLVVGADLVLALRHLLALACIGEWLLRYWQAIVARNSHNPTYSHRIQLLL